MPAWIDIWEGPKYTSRWIKETTLYSAGIRVSKCFRSGKNQKIYHSVINWLHDVAIRSFSKPLLLLLIVLLLLLIVTLLCIFLSPRFISVRGVFRTHSNIYDGAFCLNSWRLSAVDHFRKKLYLRCLTEFSMRLFQYYFFVLHLWQIWQL